MISRKMKILDFHKISYVLVSIDTLIVGMTGFEPATTRPPGVYATGLRYIPILNSKKEVPTFKTSTPHFRTAKIEKSFN